MKKYMGIGMLAPSYLKNDYYPFGMPMPNRQETDANAYRYMFQGQEKDPETGKEAFELRLWDSRIGRWLTTDPYGQYGSPYLGMGNDPINRIDPDGGQDCGCKGKKDPPDWSSFFNNFFQSMNSFFSSIGSENGPDQDYMDQVNKQQDVMNALTADLQGRQEFMQTATTIASLPVGAGSGSVLSASLVTKGGLTAIAKRGLFSFSTKGAGGRVLIEGTTELFSSGFDPGEMNILGLGAAVFSNNLGVEFIGNAFSLTANRNFQTNSYDKTIINFAVGRANNNIHSGLGKVSESLGNKGSVNVLTNTFNIAGQTGTKFLGNSFIND